MKKMFAFLLVLVMALSMAACAADPKPTETTPSTEATKPAGVMTFAEYLAAGEEAPVVVECYVQATQSWYNNAIVIYAQDNEGGYFAYNANCSEDTAKLLVPGTKIRITGYKTFYKGMPEIAAGAEFAIVEGDTYVAKAEDMTSLLGSDDLVKKAGMLGAFKGLTVAKIEYKNGEPGDDIYVDFTLGDKTYSFCVERYLTGPETDVYKAFANLKVGDKVDVEGFVYWYDGINTHITAVAAAK